MVFTPNMAFNKEEIIMNSTFTKSAIAMALAAWAGYGAAQEEIITTQTTNVVDVEMTKNLSLSKNITIEGGINVRGTITPDSAAVAVIDDKQFNSGNNSVVNNGPAQNVDLLNEASSSDDMLNGATGNIAVNINAGDNNMQDNAAALAATDSNFVFGLVDAEVFVHQDAHQNTTTNHNVENTSKIGQRAFQSASGNIGVNFAAGNSNLQKNNFSGVVANAASAEATVNTQQHSTGNLTSNSGEFVPVNGEPGVVSGHFETAEVELTGPLSGYDTGVMSGSYGNPANPTEEIGTYTQNGPVPGDGYSSNHTGMIGSNEESEYGLTATFTGDSPYYVIDECGFCSINGGTTFATNTVSLDNQAFMGATGNIGANMAAGTGNLQSNSMAMSVTH